MLYEEAGDPKGIEGQAQSIPGGPPPSPPTRISLAAPDPALAGLSQLEPVHSLAQASIKGPGHCQGHCFLHWPVYHL